MLAAAENHSAIMAELEKVLAWPEIARSPQLGKFLQYIVRQTLEGDERAIKAYSIAVDVFGRPADFDPQSDPIVRVQARRLRGLLDQYYATAGADNALRITLPVGRYLPLFEANDEARADKAPEIISPTVLPEATVISGPPGRPKGHITLSWFTLLAITAGIAALAYSLSAWEPRQLQQSMLVRAGPSVTIVEFQDLAGPGNKPVVAGLALELVTDLDAFEDIDARYGGIVSVTAPPEVAQSEFMLTGIVRRADEAVQYSAILTERASGTVVWSRTIAIDERRSMQPDALDEISRSLSLVLGSPRGPLHLPARKALNGGLPADSAASPYLCRVLFDLYRELGTSASGVNAATCYERLSETDRQTPLALAAEASLIGEGMVTPDAPALALEDRRQIAETNLERATALAPLSGFVWEQQGRRLELQGQFDAANAAYASSIQLNPANADTLAAAGRLLAFQGNLAEAEPLASRAVTGSPMPPSWYYAVPTLLALRDSQFQMAIANAQTYTLADPELGSVLAVVAASESGSARVVNRYLPQVLEVASFRATGIMPQLRKRIRDAALLDRIGKELTTAGVPQQALAGPF